MEEKENNLRFEEFKTELTKLHDAESQVRLAVIFMEEALAQDKKPDFKNFWEVRKLCLNIFKEKIPAQARQQLWNRYCHLSEEAKKLRDLLDEEGKFTSEQIDSAILSLEEEVNKIPELLKEKKAIPLIENAKSLEKNRKFYLECQQELDLLNVYAARINHMRKELIKTEIRIGAKNKFFQRLSKVGDLVFPKRKELINEISHRFETDVEEYISRNFNPFFEKEPPFAFRQEIKSLQSAAKAFTLNTQVFNQTRLKLSECWDKLKQHERERKKEFSQRKEKRKQNANEIGNAISELSQKFQAGEANISQAEKMIEEIIAKMRKLDLGKEELVILREKIEAFNKNLSSKESEEVELRQKEEALRNRHRQEISRAIKSKIDALLSNSSNLTIEEFIQGKEDLLHEIQHSELFKVEKQGLEKELKPFKDILDAKKEKELMNLPDDKRLALEQLKELLQSRKEKRQNIEYQLKELKKKGKGSSGLNFEKALQIDNDIREEKMRYESADQAVKEIEEKIKDMGL